MLKKSTEDQIRPTLTKDITAKVFRNFYWTKAELVYFCNMYGLFSQGGKIDLTNRIELFLETGEIKNLKKTNKNIILDSSKEITRETKVINYKNNAKTRSFFEKEIGPHFHFNTYLRQFANVINADNKLTYGDLVNGWINEEANKKNSNYKSTIDKQFEFNQFQRDFYASEKGKTRKEFIKAWQLVRSAPGAATYEHYLVLINQKSSSSMFDKKG